MRFARGCCNVARLRNGYGPGAVTFQNAQQYGSVNNASCTVAGIPASASGWLLRCARGCRLRKRAPGVSPLLGTRHRPMIRTPALIPATAIMADRRHSLKAAWRSHWFCSAVSGDTTTTAVTGTAPRRGFPATWRRTGRAQTWRRVRNPAISSGRVSLARRPIGRRRGHGRLQRLDLRKPLRLTKRVMNATVIARLANTADRLRAGYADGSDRRRLHIRLCSLAFSSVDSRLFSLCL
jgi:hypothetical protein